MASHFTFVMYECQKYKFYSCHKSDFSNSLQLLLFKQHTSVIPHLVFRVWRDWNWSEALAHALTLFVT